MDKLKNINLMREALCALKTSDGSVYATGDTGMLALAVRSDADVAFSDDGEYTPLQTDEGGRLKVSIEGSTIDITTIPEPLRGTLTDASGSITTGGASQQVFAVNATRTMFMIQNVSDEDLWINFTSAASAGAGSYKLTPGGLITSQGVGFTSTEAINILGATAGKEFTAKQA